MTTDWQWVSSDVAQAIHEEQLVQHGGGSGVRDISLLESALAKPEQLAHYGTPDVFDLAAAYAFGISRNHPFIDGNKRAALGACIVFLRLNGIEPKNDGPEWEELAMAVAASLIDRAEATRRLRKFLGKR